jgi:arsenite methyltransferase
VFLAANIARENGKVIGIGMTGKMRDKARDIAEKYNYKNVEFRQGTLKKGYPLRTVLQMG